MRQCDYCQEETIFAGIPEAKSLSRQAFPVLEVRTTSFAPEIQPTAECCRNFHFVPEEGGCRSIRPICPPRHLEATSIPVSSLSPCAPARFAVRQRQTDQRPLNCEIPAQRWRLLRWNLETALRIRHHHFARRQQSPDLQSFEVLIPTNAVPALRN